MPFVDVQPDWNQNDETAADYVKNRPFYTGDLVETEILDVCAMATTAGVEWVADSGIMANGLAIYINAGGTDETVAEKFLFDGNIEIGEQYSFYVNGQRYDYVAENGSDYEWSDTIMLGDVEAAIANDFDNVNVFLLLYDARVTSGTDDYAGKYLLYLTYVASDTAPTEYKLYDMQQELKKLDPVYLPATYAQSVNSKTPDEAGNVELTNADVGAAKRVIITVTDGVASMSATEAKAEFEAGNIVVLQYNGHVYAPAGKSCSGFYDVGRGSDLKVPIIYYASLVGTSVKFYEWAIGTTDVYLARGNSSIGNVLYVSDVDSEGNITDISTKSIPDAINPIGLSKDDDGNWTCSKTFSEISSYTEYNKNAYVSVSLDDLGIESVLGFDDLARSVRLHYNGIEHIALDVTDNLYVFSTVFRNYFIMAMIGPDEITNITVTVQELFNGSWNNLTDRPFGEETTRINCNFDISSEWTDITGTGLIQVCNYTIETIPVEGDAVVVVFDGVEYERVVAEGGVVGNMAILNSMGGTYEDTGEPFMFAFANNEGDMGYTNVMDSKPTVEVYKVVSEIKTIDPKYLPEEATTQADWNVNDESDSAYVKNRPFYDGREYEVEEFTVESVAFESTNTDGLEYIDVGSTRLYYVSKASPTPEQCVGATLTIVTGGVPESGEIEEGHCSTLTEQIFSLFEFIYIVNEDNAVVETITFPKKGIYITDGVCDSVTLTFPSPVTTVTKTLIGGEVVQIDKKYLPETIFTVTLTPNSDRTSYTADKTFLEIRNAYLEGKICRAEIMGSESGSYVEHSLSLCNIPNGADFPAKFIDVVYVDEDALWVLEAYISESNTVRVTEQQYRMDTDAKLITSGVAADAKATGNAINSLSTLVGDTAVSEQISTAISEIPDPSWNDLKDKPFGEESAVFLDWNGDTTGLETVYIDFNGEPRPCFYRVGDAVPYTLHEINALAETAEFKTINSAGFTDVKWGNAQQFAEDGTYAFAINYMEDPETNAMTVVVNSMADNFDIGPHLVGGQCILPSKGLWVMANCVAFQYVAFEQVNTIDPKYIPDTIARTSDLQTISDSISTLVGDTAVADQIDAALANSQPDWNQNDSTQPDYVKNRPFYTGDPVETTLFEDVALSNTEAQLYVTEISLDTSVLKAGLASKLVVNSVPYSFIWSELEDAIYAGNLSFVGEFEDTGEPYFMVGINGSFALYWLGDEGATYSASLYLFLEAIEKLPEKFYDKSLPKVTTNDNDKYAVVVDGVWTASSPDLGWRVLLDKTRENAIATATNRIFLLASEMKPVKELFIQIKLPENANSGDGYYIVLPYENVMTYKISSQGGFYTFHFVPAGRSIIPLYALGPDGAMFPSSENKLFGFTHVSNIYKFFNSCYIELRKG